MSPAAAGLLDAMRAHGLEPKEPLCPDGSLHRVTWKGDAPGSAAGWYVLHANGKRPGGAFGCWKRGISETWAADGEPLSETERRELKTKIEADRAARDREEAERHERVAALALERWNDYEPAPADHSYLQRKAVEPHGLRIDERGRLVG